MIFSFSIILVFFGAIISAIGGFWACKQQDKINKKSRYISFPRLLILIGAILAATGGLWEAAKASKFQEEIRYKQDKINEKNQKIADLNNYILSSITGDDSFCFLQMANIDYAKNTAILLISHRGKYPMYDVIVRIVDLDEFRELKDKREISFEDLKKKNMIFDIGNIPSGVSVILKGINLGERDEKRYNIFISARNGYFTQNIIMKRTEDKWESATRLTKNTSGKDIEIFKDVNPNFPKKDEIDWRTIREEISE